MLHRQQSCSIQCKLIFILVAIMLCLSGCERKSPPPAQRPRPQVSFVELQPEQIVLTTMLPGRTSPFRVAQIRPQVNGLVQKRLFTEGAEVAAGQVLYQIDPAPFEAAYDNAKAALAQAEANLPAVKARAERYRKMVTIKAVSQQDYDDAAAMVKQVEANIQSGRAALQSARINLNYAKVTAPICGRIGKSNITDGAIVTAYQPMPLATIQQLDPIYVDIPQSTVDLLRLKSRLKDGRLQQGADQDKVKLIFEDGTVYSKEGTLQFSDITVDPTTGSVTLRALFPNPEGILLPGMFVQTVINEGINEQAILVPQQGVSRDPKGNPFALVVDSENKAAYRPLTLEKAIGDKWIVNTGLAAGDKVIVEGLLMLRPGTPVNATPFQPGATTSDAGQPPAAAK